MKGVAGIYLSPLGSLALGTVANLTLPTIGENVQCQLMDETNKNLFFTGQQCKSYDYGDGIASCKRFTSQGLMQGKYYIALTNDNYVQGIDVNVKVSAIIEHKKFKDEVYIEKQVNPKYEKQIVKEPVISTKELPVTFDYKG